MSIDHCQTFFTPELTNNEANNVLFRSLLKLSITDTNWSLTPKHASKFLNKNPFTRSMHLMRLYNKIATLGRPYNNWDEVVRATEDFLERTRWFFSLSPSFTSFPSKCLTLLRFGISSLQRRKEREESEQRNTHKELNTDLTETVRLGSDSSSVTELSTHWWQKTSLSIAYSATSSSLVALKSVAATLAASGINGNFGERTNTAEKAINCEWLDELIFARSDGFPS